MTDDLRIRLDAMSTTELVDILTRRDTGEWRQEVFPLVEALLLERGVELSAPVAGAEQPDDPGSTSLTSVATHSSAMEANLCKMALDESGIQAWLSTEHLAGISPPLGLAIGVDVLVRDEDAAAAREMLQELDEGGASIPLDEEPCPKCGSTDTEHVQRADRMGAVAGWTLMGMPRPSVKWQWVCRQCQHEWQ